MVPMGRDLRAQLTNATVHDKTNEFGQCQDIHQFGLPPYLIKVLAASPRQSQSSTNIDNGQSSIALEWILCESLFPLYGL